MEDYKKKYEDALERAREMCAMPTDKATMEYVFPELKESEDEKIRKSLLNEFTHLLSKGCNKFAGLENEDIITWLEKQVSPDMVAEAYLRGCNDTEKKWIEKQGEQKPFDYENANIQQKDFAPKVEPKYKAGDWIVSKCGDLFQIKEVVAGGYKLLCPSGNEEINSIRNVDKSSYLWSIAKARPGNVLATSQSIFIFKGFYIANKPKAYCGIMNGSFINCPEGCWTNEQCYPATEEQRKLLFEKMAEAGYEWDDEKKELKEIKINPDDLIEENYQQQADDLIDMVTEEST